MRTLLIYADFDWLKSPVLLGELGYESLRGSDSYSFKFDNDWLRRYGGIFLSADINNYAGNTLSQAKIFSDVSVMRCLTDGAELCLTVVNRFLRLKKNVL